VRFKLYPQGGQTLVELTHSGFATDEALGKAVKSWVFYLENLKSVIEEQTDLRLAAAKKVSRPVAHPAARPPRN
jgi:hypothetical protein